jgi:predicted transcriptional regulator
VVRAGKLERAVMEALWAAPTGLSAADVVAALTGRALAVTTVLTVLERLRGKGMVQRERDGRAYRYRAAAEREALVARAMLEALGDSDDRALAISRFVDGMPAEDVEALHRTLHRGPRERG